MQFITRGIRGYLAISLMTLAAVASSSGQVTQYRFDGTVTSVLDPQGLFSGLVNAGDAMNTLYGDAGALQFGWELDIPSVYWGSKSGFAPSSLNAGGFSDTSSTYWSIDAFDQKQLLGQDLLTFRAETFDDSSPYFIFWETSLVKNYDGFPTPQFQNDWLSVITPITLSEMTMSLIVWKKNYSEDGGWSAGQDDLYAKITGSVSTLEFTGTSPSAVPEPSTYALASSILLVAVAGLRRCKNT